MQSEGEQTMQWFHRKVVMPFVACLLWCGSTAVAHANLITNGDFSTGDFTGWTLFTTPNGTLGEAVGLPDVVAFDTDGDTTATPSARFQVGQVIYSESASALAGGGLFQSFASVAGSLDISVDIAAVSDGPNGSGGRFRLFFDGHELASHEFGALDAAETARHTLMGKFIVEAGIHELRLDIRRPARSGTYLHHTPLQFVDNVMVNYDLKPTPEPGTIALVGTGLIGLLGYGWRQRRSTP